MADAADSKSVGGNLVRVRVSPSAKVKLMMTQNKKSFIYLKNSNSLLLKLLAAITIAFSITTLLNIINTVIKKSKISNINLLILYGAQKFINNNINSSYDFSHKNFSKNDGSYNVDCSGFVNLVLVSQNIINPIKEIIDFIPKNFVPPILSNIPSPLHYSFFLEHQTNKQHWNFIDDASLLNPGDFIVYTKHQRQHQQNSTNNEYGQHIMIVAGYPKKTITNPQLLWVPIFDSTRIPHGKTDQRYKDSTNGIGQGMIGLILNNKNKPIHIIWRDHYQDISWQPKKNDFLERDIKIARIKRL